MSLFRCLMATLAVVGAAAPAMADFVRPVPPNEPPGLYGPNRIGANDVTSALEGQRVDACGRVGVVNAAMHAMQIGNRLIIFPPPGVDPTPYMGTVVCAAGIVQTKTMNGWTQPTITTQSDQDFVQIGGTGHYDGPRPACSPAEMTSDGRCGPRHRASPY